MKITQTESSPKKAIIISVIVVLLLAAGAAAYFVATKDKDESSELTAPSEEQLNEAQKTKQNTIENSPETATPTPKEDPVETAPQSTLTLSIPYSDATRLTVLISGVVTGNCTLTLSNGATTQTQQAVIQAGPNSSTCAGFNYPALSSGTWTATVTATTDSSLSGSATSTIQAN